MFAQLRLLAFAIAAALALATASVLADDSDDDFGNSSFCSDDDDHEQARAAREGDAILPLEDILLALEGQLSGVIIEIEFDCEDGMFVYEIAVRTPAGRIIEWLVNAATGELIGEDD